MSKPRVLIVGAGVVGLVTAILLVQTRKFKVTIIDKGEGPTGLSKATGLWPVTFEVFQKIGVDERVKASGHFINQSRFFDHKNRALFSLHYQPNQGSVSQLFVIPQNRLEEILIEQLISLGVKIRYKTELTTIGVEHGKTILRFQGSHIKTISQRKYDYLLACDGAHSTVAQQTLGPLGISNKEDSKTFFAVDLLLQWPKHQIDETYAYLTKWGLLFFIPLPTPPSQQDQGYQLYRVTGIYAKHRVAHTPDMETLETQLIALGAHLSEESKSAEIKGFRVVYKQVKSYIWMNHDLPILFLGDAARTQGPAGAQGISTGFMDALKAVEVLADNQPLETYHRSRAPGGAKAIRVSKRADFWGGMHGNLAILRNQLLHFVASNWPDLVSSIALHAQHQAMTFS